MPSWNDAAFNAVTDILTATRYTPTFEELYEAGEYATMANLAYDSLNDTPQSIVDLLVRKQRDYGHENILRFGRDGVLVRLWDKVARYNNLTAKPHHFANFEPIEDTLRDIIGYVVILVMLGNGTFTYDVD